MNARHIPFGAPVVTAAQMRAAEQAVFDAGVSVDDMMERAGLAVAREVRRFAAGRPVLVAAGPGNNGGDAYVAARHLFDWGLDVVVAALAQPGQGAAERMAARWTGTTRPIDQAETRPVFVDGLFGTGTMRPLPEKLARHIGALRMDSDFSIAIDLPSGVDPDGITSNDFLFSRVTVALGALKVGHVVGEHVSDCGDIILADIGVPVCSHVSTIRPAMLNPIEANANKFTRGMVAVVGGAMPGASRLAATAAMRAGAGYVVLAEEQPAGCLPHALVQRRIGDAAALDAVLNDERIGAVVVGPGLGRDKRARALLDRALASSRDLVIDADALSLIGPNIRARLAGHRRRVFMTPHSGEFDRLFGEGGGNKIDRTLAAAAHSGATVVHKGADTVIATPDGRAVVSAGATSWLSTAGTGDVLAGVLAACHAQARDYPLETAGNAVWLHAAAGSLAGAPLIADDVVQHLPAAVAAATPS